MKALLFRVAASLAIIPHSLWAWGSAAHPSITQGALEVLPAWEKEMLGQELSRLGAEHCQIPDQVHSKPEIRKYATMDSRPGLVYLVNLHLPESETSDSEVLNDFLERSVKSFAAGEVADGARFAGTVVHVLEDWGCPAHSVPGDNMFTLFKQFLPPPEAYKYVAMHGPVENGKFETRLGSYQPKLLGTSVPEAAFHLLRRVRESTIHARGQVIPILQALYAGDEEASNAAQQKAAEVDGTVVADALHTIFCLARQQFEPEAVRALDCADLSICIPSEAANLAMPQTAFFSKPYWGHALRGITLRDGKEPVPLRLRIESQGEVAEKAFDQAWGVGTRSRIHFALPSGIYERFECWVGLQPELGAKGCVVFEVTGNEDQPLAKVGPVKGDAPARRVSVPLAGVTTLQLTASSAGGDGLGNYAVWAEPRLVKAKRP